MNAKEIPVLLLTGYLGRLSGQRENHIGKPYSIQ